jgi:hypothetical protein
VTHKLTHAIQGLDILDMVFHSQRELGRRLAGRALGASDARSGHERHSVELSEDLMQQGGLLWHDNVDDTHRRRRRLMIRCAGDEHKRQAA